MMVIQLARLLTWPLTLAAAGALLLAAFPPGEAALAHPGLRALLLGTAALLLGTLAIPRGGDLVFIRLWSALGLTLGAALICLLAVSPLPLLAYLMVIAVIPLTPNHTGEPSRASWRNLCLFCFGLGGSFLIAFIA